MINAAFAQQFGDSLDTNFPLDSTFTRTSFNIQTIDVESVDSVPEPGTNSLLAVGTLALLWMSRRAKRRRLRLTLNPVSLLGGFLLHRTVTAIRLRTTG